MQRSRNGFCLLPSASPLPPPNPPAPYRARGYPEWWQRHCGRRTTAPRLSLRWAEASSRNTPASVLHAAAAFLFPAIKFTCISGSTGPRASLRQPAPTEMPSRNSSADQSQSSTSWLTSPPEAHLPAFQGHPGLLAYRAPFLRCLSQCATNLPLAPDGGRMAFHCSARHCIPPSHALFDLGWRTSESLLSCRFVIYNYSFLPCFRLKSWADLVSLWHADPVGCPVWNCTFASFIWIGFLLRPDNQTDQGGEGIRISCKWDEKLLSDFKQGTWPGVVADSPPGCLQSLTSPVPLGALGFVTPGIRRSRAGKSTLSQIQAL